MGLLRISLNNFVKYRSKSFFGTSHHFRSKSVTWSMIWLQLMTTVFEFDSLQRFSEPISKVILIIKVSWCFNTTFCSLSDKMIIQINAIFKVWFAYLMLSKLFAQKFVACNRGTVFFQTVGYGDLIIMPNLIRHIWFHFASEHDSLISIYSAPEVYSAKKISSLPLHQMIKSKALERQPELELRVIELTRNLLAGILTEYDTTL